MQGFHLLVKFSLVQIYILKLYGGKSSSFFWENMSSIYYLHFSFEKHVLSQVLKDLSVENLEATRSTFLSKFSCKTYLSRTMNCWGSIFTLYLTWGAFSLICNLSAFFFFLLFFFFYWYFPWQAVSIHILSFFFSFLISTFLDYHWRFIEWQGRERELLFFLFLLPPASIHSFTSSRSQPLLPFFLLDLFLITGIIADDTCSP